MTAADPNVIREALNYAVFPMRQMEGDTYEPDTKRDAALAALDALERERDEAQGREEHLRKVRDIIAAELATVRADLAEAQRELKLALRVIANREDSLVQLREALRRGAEYGESEEVRAWCRLTLTAAPDGEIGAET